MSKHHTAEDWPVFHMPTPAQLQQLAASLPAPTAGRIIPIPLYLYPTYMAMHRLTPKGASPLGNVYVKREVTA
jgi:hypothetical protein